MILDDTPLLNVFSLESFSEDSDVESGIKPTKHFYLFFFFFG